MTFWLTNHIAHSVMSNFGTEHHCASTLRGIHRPYEENPLQSQSSRVRIITNAIRLSKVCAECSGDFPKR